MPKLSTAIWTHPWDVQMELYRSLAPAEMPVLPIMRAIPPQVIGQEDLKQKLVACDPESVAGFGFYNYGFMRYTTLDWIKTALAEL